MTPNDDDPVEVYRREVANVVRLTKEEAVHLFQEARQSVIWENLQKGA